MSEQWVAGVDGCRTGWVVALREVSTRTMRVTVVASFTEILALAEAPRAIAIDVPIGLLSTGRPGGRACDQLARAALGTRRSSVFSPPSRRALAAFRRGDDYREVSAANAARGPRLSKQTFNILPKIDEVDRAITKGTAIYEAHPELCFAEANGGAPMRAPKKSAAGGRERLALLKRLGFMAHFDRPRGVQPDDVLDACIACWTAERIARGTAVSMPAHVSRDPRGLRMAVWR